MGTKNSLQPRLTLTQTQAKQLAGKSWSIKGTRYKFADYDPRDPGMPPWKSGAEGIAYPLLDRRGEPRAYTKFFDQLRCSKKRVERTRWLIDQRIDCWTEQLRGAPRMWVDTESQGQPDGVGFGFSCSLAEAVPGRTWLELKLEISEGTASFDEKLRFRCVEDLVRGLTHLERYGLVHGDLSPNNIIIDVSAPPGRPALYLIDFDAFCAANAGRLSELSAAEGGTYGTSGYCPPELDARARTDARLTAPFSDLYARDMLLLEIICFEADCDFETPISQWSRSEVMSRLGARPLGSALRHLQSGKVFDLGENERLSNYELAGSLGISTAPRIKRFGLGPNLRGYRTNGFRPEAETWLRRGLFTLWLMCVLCWISLSMSLVSWLTGGAGTVGLLHFVARALLAAGAMLAGAAGISILAFSGREARVLNVAGLGFLIPARRESRRSELSHLALVCEKLLAILTALCVFGIVS